MHRWTNVRNVCLEGNFAYVISLLQTRVHQSFLLTLTPLHLQEHAIATNSGDQRDGNRKTHENRVAATGRPGLDPSVTVGAPATPACPGHTRTSFAEGAQSQSSTIAQGP